MIMLKCVAIDFTNLCHTDIGGASVSNKVALKKQLCQDVQLEHHAKIIVNMFFRYSFIWFLVSILLQVFIEESQQQNH